VRDQMRLNPVPYIFDDTKNMKKNKNLLRNGSIKINLKSLYIYLDSRWRFSIFRSRSTTATLDIKIEDLQISIRRT
ncbi:MAG: hypothetical protein ACI8RD_002953, partial [Bacillariaceae sp.]